MKITILTWLSLTACLCGADLQQVSTSTATVQYYKNSPLPQAVVLSMDGECLSSTNGESFKRMRIGDTLDQGASIRTGAKSRVDLFMRRMAITIRVTPETDIKIEKMVRQFSPGSNTVETVLNLKEGRVLCFVRGVVPNSRFEVRHSGAKSIVEGEGMGGFEVRADSAAVAPRQSYVPLKIVTDRGVAIVSPGQKYSLKDGKAMELAATEVEETLMQLDELQALSDLLSPNESQVGGKTNHSNP